MLSTATGCSREENLTGAATVTTYKTVTSIACRALVSAVQTHLTSRSPPTEKTSPFLTKLLGAASNSQHTVPRAVLELHTRLNEAETLPSAPFGHHDSDEQLFRSHAWYSLITLAALELPDVPFHALLSTCTTTALQDVISRDRARFVQAASEQPPSTPTVSEVCEVLQAFYQDAYAQHWKQDRLVKALKLPEDRRHDMEHFAELFGAAAVDFFWHCQEHGITDTPLPKHTLATCTWFRLLLTAQKPAAPLNFRFGPTLRLLANFKRECCKQYTPHNACGGDVELAANRLPAYFSRLADSSEQPVPSSSSALRCWLCVA